MSTFYTSDTHFSHQRIIELSGRPFGSVEEMDEEMIARWNARVGMHDTVIHLGDVALGKIAHSLPLISRLNGYKILVPGNHDRVFSGFRQTKTAQERFAREYREVFDEVWDEAGVVWALEGGATVYLCHFPYTGDSQGEERYKEFRPTDLGLPLVHGHVHEAWRENGRQFNVGVDRNGFAPVPEQVLVDWVASLRHT